MKKILFTLVAVLISGAVFSQLKPTKSKIEEIHQAIQQGRDQVVEKILTGNHTQALNLYSQLIAKYGKNYVLFYPREELLVALAARNFKMFADSALVYSPVIAKKKNPLVYQFPEKLHNYVQTESANILEQLENSGLPENYREVVEIYLQFVTKENGATLNKNIRNYQKNHSKTLFLDFLNSLRRQNASNRLNISMGYSIEGIGGNISESFFDVMKYPKIELDGFINRTYFSLFIGGGFSNVNTRFPIIDENNETIIIDEDKVSNQKFGVKLGRIIFSNDYLTFYPYVSFGGHELSPTSVLFENPELMQPDDLKTKTLFTGFGISTDVLLKKWKKKRMYDPQGFYFVRANFGYDRFLDNQIDNFNNIYLSVSIGVSIGSG